MDDKKIDHLAHQMAEQALRANGIACLVAHARRGAASSLTRVTAHLIGDELRDVAAVYWFSRYSGAKAVLREMCRTTRTIETQADVRTVRKSETTVNVYADDVGLVLREAAARIGVILIDPRDIQQDLERTAAGLRPVLIGLAKRGGLTVQRRMWRETRTAGQPFADWFSTRIGALAADSIFSLTN